MRLIRYAVLAVIAICLVTVALANRQVVTLNLLPGEIGGLMGASYSISLPLYAIVFGGVLIGLLVGFLWEWLREHKHRAEAVRARADANRLEREVKRAKTNDDGDDVLALLDGVK